MSVIQVSAKAIIKDGDKFLMVKQTRPTLFFWDLPGGRMEYGESPEETVVREVKEETTLDVTPEKLLGVWWFISPTSKKQIVCITYLCNAKSTNVDITKNPENDPISEFAWVTKEAFLNGDYPIRNDSLKELIKTI